MRRKKILHLISGLEIGGAETQLLRILPILQKYHDNCVCCVRGRGPIGEELEKKGVKVYYLDLKNSFDIFAIKRFHRTVKDFRPDILVTYLIHADLYGRVLGRLFGIKKIICSKRGALLQWEWLAFFDRLTKRLVTHYLVQTETAKKEWMGRLRLQENKFTIIPNGVDIKLFRILVDKLEKKKELGIKNNSFVISCVSKLRPGKGHDVLLEAFEKTFGKYENIVLLLVGGGEREKELQDKIFYYSSRNNILFLGDRKDVSEILAISDLFVLPTEAEGMSNAILEAMAAGLPIITTNIEVNKELIENKKEGILVHPNDPNEFYKYLSSLIENSSEREFLGTNAKKKIIEKYNLPLVIEKTRCLLSDI
jgi:glycosyltransferase involved in cell wall biosynthesis